MNLILIPHKEYLQFLSYDLMYDLNQRLYIAGPLPNKLLIDN